MDFNKIKEDIQNEFPNELIEYVSIISERTLAPQFIVKINGKDLIFKCSHKALRDISEEFENDNDMEGFQNSITKIMIEAVGKKLKEEI